jgi:hypothetical protein
MNGLSTSGLFVEGPRPPKNDVLGAKLFKRIHLGNESNA